jgi:hypothetical protein
MIEPLPNCFSICETASSIALPRSSAIGSGSFRSTPVHEMNLAGLYI